MNLGPAEILVILVIALLIFGPARLPEIGRQVGRGVREFRKFQDVIKRDLDEVLADDSAETAKGDPAPTLPPKAIEASPEPGDETMTSDPPVPGPTPAPPAPPAPAPPSPSGDAS